MKKKILTILTLFLFLLSLSSCNLNFSDPNITIDKIYDDNTITETIHTTITKTVEKISKGCVGIISQNTTSRSIGSGVIYKKVQNLKDDKHFSDTYYVVTNEHVISKSNNIKIYLGNDLYVKCDKVGSDSVNDLAVLTFTTKINEFDLVVNEIPNEVRIPSLGGYCIAVGCPISLDNYNFVTVGNVAKCTYSDLIHTASINPGNSGGGLFDLDGRLIGINVSKLFYIEEEINGIRTQLPVDGMGNAIPSWIVSKVCSDIEKTNPVLKRTTLGIVASNVNVSLDETQVDKLPNTLNSGIVVLDVENDSNASQMTGKLKNQNAEILKGLKPGDVIYGIYHKNELKTLDRMEYLKTYIQTLVVGDTLKLGVYRNINGNWIDITFSCSLR